MYTWAMGGALQGSGRESGSGLGIAITGAVGFGAGLLFGLVAGGLVGDVGSGRLGRAVRRLRPSDDEESAGEDAERVEHELLDVLKRNPATRHLNLTVLALGGGLVELTGTVPDETTRELAAHLARGVLGGDVIVNRLLVEGTDTSHQSAVVS